MTKHQQVLCKQAWQSYCHIKTHKAQRPVSCRRLPSSARPRPNQRDNQVDRSAGRKSERLQALQVLACNSVGCNLHTKAPPRQRAEVLHLPRLDRLSE